MDDDKLETYKRTNMGDEYAKKHDLTPFEWTYDKSKGFESFMDCYSYWEDKAERNSSIDFAKVFNYEKAYYNIGKAFWGPSNGQNDNSERIPNSPSFGFLASHLKEMDVYQVFEDEFDCSGMCKTGLFWFHRKLDKGPPSQTCFKHFKRAFSSSGYPFAVISILTGVVSLLLFLLHFCMYCRPLPDNINLTQNEREGYSNDDGVNAN